MKKELKGIYPAFVAKVDDPENRGRIIVTCPEVYGSTTIKSPWCEPCSPVAYDNGGDFYLPKKGDCVWISYIDGDLERPIYLGYWWRKSSTPLNPYSDPTDTRIVSFENNVVELKKDKLIVKSGDVKITIDDGNIVIENYETFTVKGDMKITGDLEVVKDVKANNVEATLKVKATTSEVSGESSTNSLTASSITSGSSTIGGISFGAHTHTVGTSETSTPH